MGNLNRALGFMLLLTASLTAAEADVAYRNGLRAYENEQWALAVQEFESIIRAGYDSEELYYNLGNAYYKMDDVAGAVWAFEKALKLDPNDSDARYSLSLANLKVKDRIEPLEVPFVIRLYRGIRESFIIPEWLELVSLAMFLAGLAFAANRLTARLKLGWLSGLFAALALVLLLVTIDAIVTTSHSRTGVIYGDAVAVFSAPSERSTRLFELHKGITVEILEAAEDWYQIELLDGKSGWVPGSLLRAL